MPTPDFVLDLRRRVGHDPLPLVGVRAERLAAVHALPRMTYANGDQVDYLDLVFRCTWVSGEPHPADGELTEVGFRKLEELGDLDPAHVRRIALAMAEDDPAHFEGGR